MADALTLFGRAGTPRAHQLPVSRGRHAVTGHEHVRYVGQAVAKEELARVAQNQRVCVQHADMEAHLRGQRRCSRAAGPHQHTQHGMPAAVRAQMPPSSRPYCETRRRCRCPQEVVTSARGKSQQAKQAGTRRTLASPRRVSVSLLVAATRSSRPASSIGQDSKPCCLQKRRTPASMAPTTKACTPAWRACATQFDSSGRNASLANVMNTSASASCAVAWRASSRNAACVRCNAGVTTAAS